MSKRLPNRGHNPWAELRRAAGLTQRQVAELCRCSRSLISLIETEQRRPSPDVAGIYHRLQKEAS